MEKFYKEIESILHGVSRPGRYVGNELHIVKKNSKHVQVSFALAFPDVYEIGMSHIGMEILYHILNRLDWIAAERVYSPWIDMEKKMRERGIPLFSLESKKPIRNFDILGITLQYELQYTNVLNLIDLAGIPLWSGERKETDPFVVVGGPCAFNPEPLADFVDVVVLGDGEEAVVELAEVVRQSKQKKWSRKETLKELSRLKGFYVPSFYLVENDSDGKFLKLVPKEQELPSVINAKILEKLSPENYPSNPLVPLIEVTHNRFSLEIMRGCTRGCRFCNAGIIYRPVRERSVDDLVKEASGVIRSTGYEEISLVSLSTSDYTNLLDLLSRLKNTFNDKGVSISFPSLRADTFTPEMADFAMGPRRSGLTLAPEAGTQRLRDVINKNTSEADVLKAVEIGYQRNWHRVKLYFMIGLPTETEEDLEGIVNLVGKIIKIGKRYGKREARVSISPFSPKAHTPFQWEKQDSLETMEEKLSFLRRKLHRKEVKLSWRDPKVSRLETVLGRGDRKLNEVIYLAWKNGARFDGWSDQFNYDLWIRAFEEKNLSPEYYTGELNTDGPLPWDHINKGVSKSYLLLERKRALSGEVTEDCRRTGCKGCGLMTHPVCREIILNKNKVSKLDTHNLSKIPYGRRTVRRVSQPVMKIKIRVGYKKKNDIRFTSHLDLSRMFIRALRRANIPVAMSQGYHVHPRIATGPPLPLGYTSQAEYLDIEIDGRVPQNFEEIINRHLPAGLEVFESKISFGDIPSLNSSINLASYLVELRDFQNIEGISKWIDEFLKKNSYQVIRTKREMEKKVDIRPYVAEADIDNEGIRFLIRLDQNGTAKVEEVIRAILPPYEELPEPTRVERTGLYIEKQGIRLTPLEVID